MLGATDSKQNFKKPIIQRRDPRDAIPEDERASRGEVRWGGATDSGLRDVRGDVRLWGLDIEVKRHAEIWAMHENKHLSAVEISEKVFDEEWPLKRRQELYRATKGVEYDGKI